MRESTVSGNLAPLNCHDSTHADQSKDMRSIKMSLPEGIRKLGGVDNKSDLSSEINLFKDECSELNQVRH